MPETTEPKYPEFAISKPKITPVGINNSFYYKIQGPFDTKAGAKLYVPGILPFGKANGFSCLPLGERAEDFFHIDPEEEKLLIDFIHKTYPKFNFDTGADRDYFQTDLFPGKGSETGG